MNIEKHIFQHAFKVISMLLLCANCFGADQLTKADYEKANQLRSKYRNKVINEHIKVNWLNNGSKLWYRLNSTGGQYEFIIVDAKTGTKKAAFDHDKLAKALAKETKEDIDAKKLPIAQLEFPGDSKLTFISKGKKWQFNFKNYKLKNLSDDPDTRSSITRLPRPRASRRQGPRTSITFINQTKGKVELFWIDTRNERHSYGKLAPDSQRTQSTHSGHVWLVADEAGKTLAVFYTTADGGDAVIDGSKFVPDKKQRQSRRRQQSTFRQHHPGPKRKSPDGKWQAFVKEYNLYLKDVNSSQECQLTSDGTEKDGYMERFYFSLDSKKLVALRREKGEQRKVVMVESSPEDQLQPKLHTIDYTKPGDKIDIEKPRLFDIATKSEIPVSDELFDNPYGIWEIRWAKDSKEFAFFYNQRGHQVVRIVGVNAKTGKARAIVNEETQSFFDYRSKLFGYYLDDTKEMIWMSERDGWNHLYLYDTKTASVKNQITKGQWVVRSVENIDEKKRQILFWAGGIYPDQDPYYLHLCRINFDGSGLTKLTSGDGTHKAEFSPDKKYFIDRWSRVDLPPVTDLRNSKDGKLICELAKADHSELLKAGWQQTERFVAKGRDGRTNIYGIIIRPSNFDPNSKYPVIEDIYAGPHGATVPKSFSTLASLRTLAELGFIIVHIDGMGTNFRSKAFHDVAWKNIADAGFPDRILWMKAAAKKYPYMDIERVGIFGTSAGGQNALGALLWHGDFYKAAVANCGCHDNRMDKIWWNELWMSWPIGPHYEEQSNVTQAHKLTGDLLLIVGELDKNVDPASTMQVVDALVKAKKDFELLVVPGGGHGAGGEYGRRRRNDFFVKHLLGKQPPNWNTEN